MKITTFLYNKSLRVGKNIDAHSLDINDISCLIGMGVTKNNNLIPLQIYADKENIIFHNPGNLKSVKITIIIDEAKPEEV